MSSVAFSKKKPKQQSELKQYSKQKQKRTINWFLCLLSLFSLFIMLMIRTIKAENSLERYRNKAFSSANLKTFYKPKKLQHYLVKHYQSNVKVHEEPLSSDTFIDNLTPHYNERNNVKRMRHHRSLTVATKTGEMSFRPPKLIKFDLADAIEPNEEMKKLLRKHYNQEGRNAKAIDDKNKTNIESITKSERKI